MHMTELIILRVQDYPRLPVIISEIWGLSNFLRELQFIHQFSISFRIGRAQKYFGRPNETSAWMQKKNLDKLENWK